MKLAFKSIEMFIFQEAVKLKPTFSDAYLNLGNVYKVRCCQYVWTAEMFVIIEKRDTKT